MRLKNHPKQMAQLLAGKENGDLGTCEALDLSMPSVAEIKIQSEEKEGKTNDSSTSSNCDVPLDLSVGMCEEKLSTSLRSVNCDSIPQVNGRLENLVLYKMLTDPIFFENIKKSRFPSITCQYCKKDFMNQTDWFNHQRGIMNEIDDKLFCCVCNKIFTTRRYLRSHQRCHLERKIFICNICTRQYSRLDNLLRHTTCHINPNKFQCPFCEKSFTRKDLFNKHIKRHENKYRYYCGKCGKYFRGPLILEKHNKNFHPTVQ